VSAPLAFDLSGRSAVVTGASAGIGKEIARDLARMGASVVLACRSAERGEAARQEISATTGNSRVEVLTVDLSSRASIHAFADILNARGQALHVLVNNAGIWAQRRQQSPDGIELTWATNVLGYFLVTELLLGLLKAGAPSRIVNVASILARGLELDDVEFRRRRYSGITAYSQSKQANRMWTWALARRLAGTGVSANAMHPGGVSTELFRKGGGVLAWLVSVYAKLTGLSPQQGADTASWLAASPAVEGKSGGFWIERQESPCPFRDAAREEALFELCSRMTRG
jgi:NAD(P)-dependent dehydrogenase (short-subunit alcohol dehydrogenase family)